MTARYVALLRGVNNIGMTRRVPMADLRVLFERLGFRDVRTLLNSGNVVFSAPDATRSAVLARIQQGLADRFGLTVPVILLSGREVARVVRDNPLLHLCTNLSHFLVVVPLRRPDLRRLQPLLRQRWRRERLALGSRVAYLWLANGLPRSPLWMSVDRALEHTGTARNLATMTKLVALAGATVAQGGSGEHLSARRKSRT